MILPQNQQYLKSDEIYLFLYKTRQSLGPAPLSEKGQKTWDEKVSKMEKNVDNINKSIQKFNLIVPSIHHQKFPVNLAKEAEKIFSDGFDPNVPSEKSKPKKDYETGKKPAGLLSGLFPSLYNKS